MPSFLRLLAPLLVGAACALPSIVHAAAPGGCTFTPVAKLPLRYSGPSLEITTEGSINGKAARLLVDTGAYQTFVTRTGVERHGLTLRSTGEVAYGVGGMVPIYETRISEFVAGPARAGRRDMPVLHHFGYTPSYDAILGSPFLLQLDLEVSLAAKAMTFFVPKNCGDTYLGYWDESVRDVPFEPHEEAGLNPHFIVHVNGQKMVAMIDTGAGTSSIWSKAARRAGIAVGAPGSKRDEDTAGVGGSRLARWVVALDSFQIGEETVRNAEFAVIESDQEGADVILGADFLRAHRVLFAMSQKKLYFSYVGGEPFGQRRALEPWIQAEADGGNADAQLALANAYLTGKLVPRDDARADGWLAKAVAGGSPHALLSSGRALLLHGDVAAGTARLRAALDALPAERNGALWLYIARVRGAQPELAKSELAAAFARSDRNEWPKPIADFYLGKLPADKLLAQAAADRVAGGKRRCEALAAMVEWHRAHAQPEQAKALNAQRKTACSESEQAEQGLADD